MAEQEKDGSRSLAPQSFGFLKMLLSTLCALAEFTEDTLLSILSYCIPYNSILFCSVLFCSVRFYSVLFYSILFYSILFYSILSVRPLLYSIPCHPILWSCPIILYHVLSYSMLYTTQLHSVFILSSTVRSLASGAERQSSSSFLAAGGCVNRGLLPPLSLLSTCTHRASPPAALMGPQYGANNPIHWLPIAEKLTQWKKDQEFSLL